jgi:hypothetical protein
MEHNTSLLQLDLRDNYAVSERTLLTLAESLPEIKVLQQVYFDWCTGLASAMPFMLAGLRKKTSLFRFHVVFVRLLRSHQQLMQRPNALAAGGNGAVGVPKSRSLFNSCAER